MLRRILILLAAAGLMLPAQDEAPAPTGVIRGVIRNSVTGQPIPEATVTATRVGPRKFGTVDEQGQFEITGLPPGHHLILARWPVPDTLFGVFGSKWVQLGEGQRVDGVEIEIEPPARISGTITDANHEPMQGIRVFLVAREYSFGKLRYVFSSGMQITDDTGFYSMALTPGVGYLLMAQDRQFSMPAISEEPVEPKWRKPVAAPTYYPGVSDRGGAQIFNMRPGEIRENVDIEMERSPGWCASGIMQALGAPGEVQFEIQDMQAHSGRSGTVGMYISGRRATTAADGEFRICDLYPGSYQIAAITGDHSSGPTGWSVTPLTITDRDVTRLVISTLPTVSLSGEVLWDGDTPPTDGATLRFHVQGISRSALSQERDATNVTVPGSFVKQGLVTEEVSLEIERIPDGSYVKELRYGGDRMPYRVFVPGSAISGEGLRITLAGDGGKIHARVVDEDGEVAPDTGVAIFSARATNEVELTASLQTSRTDQNGNWTTGALAPGSYYVIPTALRHLDPTPEFVSGLWRARVAADPVKLAPSSDASVTLEIH